MWTIGATLPIFNPAWAQRSPVNYDETKVGSYTLPDPLVLQNGVRVRDAATWNEQRRPEILRLYEANMFGRSPDRAAKITADVFDSDRKALGGKAVRKQVTLHFLPRKEGPRAELLMYLPANASKPVPVFLCLNFTGNHKVMADPKIKLAEVWDRNTKIKQPAPRDGTRNLRPVANRKNSGYGLATIYYCDLEPDFVGGISFECGHTILPLGSNRAGSG